MAASISPSQTKSGVQFVEAFKNEDQPLARLLLDSLKLVDEGQFMSGLTNALNRALSTLDGPIGLIPVGELPRLEEEETPENDRTSYENVDSRDIVKVICRNLRSKRTEVVDGWGVQALREAKVRHLVFVDDFLASGRSLRKAVNGWLKHPTMQSWNSFGYIKTHAVTFAATSRGMAKAHELRIPLHTYDSSCDLLAAALRSENINYGDAKQLISKYGTGSAKRGSGGAEGMLVIQHTVPNSLPRIFTQPQKANGDAWPQLFNRHTYEILGDLSSAWPYAPTRRIEDVLLQHVPHAAPSWIERQTDANLETILVARLTIVEHHSPEEIAQLVDIPLDQVDAALRRARTLGLDNARQLYRELRLASSPGEHSRSTPPPKSRYYFPRFVRSEG